MATRHKERVRSENGQSEAQATSPASSAQTGNNGLDASNHVERWYAANDEYLAAGLHWLRLLLSGEKAELPQARAKLRVAEAVEPPPALIALSHKLGLSRFERDTLLLCAAMELDTRIAGLCAHAHGDPAKPYPTFALALSLFDQAAWDVVAPERPLRYWRLIEIHQPANTPLTASALRADERIVNAIKGLNYLDDRLAMLMTLVSPAASGSADLPLSQQAPAQRLIAALRAAEGGRAPLVQLVGADSESKLAVAERVAIEFGMLLFRLPAGMLPFAVVEIENLARLWERERLLSSLALYVDGQEAAVPWASSGDAAGRTTEGAPEALRHFLARINGVVFVDLRDFSSNVTAGTASLALDIGRPTPQEQSDAWREAFGDSGGQDTSPLSTRLAGQFDLSQPAIERIVRAVTLESGAAPGDTGWSDAQRSQQVWQACLDTSRPELGALTQMISPKATWNDLVLPDEQVALLHQIADQVRRRSKVYIEWGFGDKMNRGLGITVLLTGESGTGKTMAAEVIANDLQLHLYRIDLSTVVSKYIGETEKNLRRVFDAAEGGGAILFFDEADALFGKRSEVKDSHDRYANIEINYLLQRMESFRGLAILASNMRNALDPAFMRRLRFVVDFPYPSASDRQLIWRKQFPARAPLDGVDFARLARLNLSGGNIQSVALNGAFLAAAAGSTITMAHLLAAARSEYRKLERPANEADFR